MLITGKDKTQKVKLTDKPIQCPLCLGWFERKWNPTRNVFVLFCHFDKIAIAANDPFVGRWEEFYAASGEKMTCPACDHKMRFFGTSTGYCQFKCPKKKCQAKIENTAPDREKGVTLLDKDGEEIKTPGIDRAIATPEAPGVTQVGDAPAPREPDVFIPLPPNGGHA